MQQTRLNYEKTRAAIFLKYGVELDETSITILLVLSGLQKTQFLEQNKKLEAVTEKIKLSTQSLQAHQQRPGGGWSLRDRGRRRPRRAARPSRSSGGRRSRWRDIRDVVTQTRMPAVK